MRTRVKKSQVALGVDFGGTSVKLGLVDRSGTILESAQFATGEASTPGAWLARLQVERDRLARGRRLAGIGVGVPGFVDFKRGFIYNLTNVPGWKNVPLAATLRRRFGLPAYVDNDVNAMAIGECAYGAGRKYRQAVFVTLGTGVGGGVVIDGRLYRGAYSMAGEIGHMSIMMNGRRSAQGRGGLENYVGNQRIVAKAARVMRAGRRTWLRKLTGGEVSRLTPRLIAAAAKRGDRAALEIFDEVADCLATTFAAVTYLLQPEAIIVGGGVAQCGRILFAPLRAHLRERLSPIFAERIRVVPAGLGASAGMIGCARLVFQHD